MVKHLKTLAIREKQIKTTLGFQFRRFIIFKTEKLRMWGKAALYTVCGKNKLL